MSSPVMSIILSISRLSSLYPFALSQATHRLSCPLTMLRGMSVTSTVLTVGGLAAEAAPAITFVNNVLDWLLASSDFSIDLSSNNIMTWLPFWL